MVSCMSSWFQITHCGSLSIECIQVTPCCLLANRHKPMKRVQNYKKMSPIDAEVVSIRLSPFYETRALAYKELKTSQMNQICVS